ncbi:hypothetical protein PCYB_002740, partial [Plasmodium cynomolgi strain B]
DVEKETNCKSLSTNLTFNNHSSGENICKEFKFLYKSFSTYAVQGTKLEDIYSSSNCSFLNFWLNDKLKNSVVNRNEINVKDFYNKIKNNNPDYFSKSNDLENYMKNIDPEIIENMKLLYDLYYKKDIIQNILLNPVEEDPINAQCSAYTKKCYEKYNAAINMCYGINDEYYKALGNFQKGYNSIIVYGEDKYNCRGNTTYLLPEYTPDLECDPYPEYDTNSEYDNLLGREEEKSMLIQGLTSSLIPLLIIPLIYKVEKNIIY